MSDIAPLEQSEDKSVESDSNRGLSERINRWVNERPMVKLWAEWNARRQIAQEIQRDIKTKGVYTRPTPDAMAQMAQIVDSHKNPVPHNDSLTGDKFFHILRRDNDDLIAEERATPDTSSDANLISQARIGPHKDKLN